MDLSKKTAIKEAIYKTIVFFDIFSYPLSAFEIWRYLNIACDYKEFDEVISSLDGQNIEYRGGYYFLKNKDYLLNTRSRRANYSDRKIKRAIRISKLFRFIPWIKMIAIGNMIGSNNLKDGSDIDFFIITKKKRIWLTRFLTTLIAKLLLVRPRLNDVRDKICLSFYIDEESLNLKNLHLDERHDYYFVYWLAGLLPIYDSDCVYLKLIDSNNWLKEYLPNFEPILVADHRIMESRESVFYDDLVDLFFGGLEREVKLLQLKILPNDLRLLMNKDTRVVINDNILKLHVKDRRQFFHEAFNGKIKELK